MQQAMDCHQHSCTRASMTPLRVPIRKWIVIVLVLHHLCCNLLIARFNCEFQLSSFLDEGFSGSIKIVLSVSFSQQPSLQISGISQF
ncbi:hypothetical protein ZIOFF_041421 [Zingiber officinale]|uniref:Uncharacterized protein n=1 Tax=Zingiber officinale TaxID=94328 RepID=A0A8J5G6L4_ZINOF|nr:hypothetical protein ZIOFF_041421 [Zingiber officinale]